MLEDLVTREASGVLEVLGIPSGAIYLDGGQIAYARASWVPGLAARLRAIAPSLSGTTEPWPGQDADDTESARLAVRHGYLTTAALHELIASVVAEAFLVLTISLAPDSLVAGVRFTPAPTHWIGLFPRLGVDAVHQEALRRAERMAACGLAPTTTVAPRDLAAPTAVLTREQWAVACQIGDRATARELALRRGASLSDTVHCLGSLVRAGLCVPVRVGPRGHATVVRRPAWSPAVPAPSDGSSAPSDGSLARSGGNPVLSDGGPALPGGSLARSGGNPVLLDGSPALPGGSLAWSGGNPVPSADHSTVPPAVPRQEPRARALTGEGPTMVIREPKWPERPVSAGEPPSVEVLRQVLEGLRKLD